MYHDLVSILLTINFPASVDYIIIEISCTHLQTLLYIYREYKGEYVMLIVNPIPAGVLENQDTLGGQFDPPPL